MEKISLTAKDGTRYSFIDDAQFAEFVNSEAAAWNWVIRLEQHGMLGSFFANAMHPLRAAQSQLAEPSPSVERAIPAFQQYLDWEPAVHLKATFGTWIRELAVNRPMQAYYALVYLFQELGITRKVPFKEHLGAQSDLVAGIALAMAFQNNWKPGEKTAINNAQAIQSSQDAATALASARETQAKINALEESMAEATTARTIERDAADLALIKKTEELVRSMEEKFKSKSDSLDNEWSRFTAEFTSQLALKAPAGYWKSKHKNHTKWVWGLGVTLAIAAASGAWVLHEMAWQIFGPLRINQIPSWFQVITFSLAAFVYVLLLRSTLRLMMSHIHLSLDSAERQTMIVSYLALLRRGGIKEESLDKILATIFRPTGDGIVKDDGIPLSALAEIFKSKP